MTKQKRVYCRKCEHFYIISGCRHSSNIKTIHTPYCKEVETAEPYEKINKNNDCKNYSKFIEKDLTIWGYIKNLFKK